MYHFRKNQKVVCIDAVQRHHDNPLGALTEGKIYTIQSCDGIKAYLEEVQSPGTIHYYSDRFRAVASKEAERTSQKETTPQPKPEEQPCLV